MLLCTFKKSSMIFFPTLIQSMYILNDLDLFIGKVKFCNLSFSIGKKVKTVEFSETIAASDLKVGRSRQIIELMNVICE